MTEYERVREQMARWLHSYVIQIRQESASWLEKLPFEDLSPDIQERWLKKADGILSLDGIEIKSDDQSLPENPYYFDANAPFAYMENTDEDYAKLHTYTEAQQDMLKAGFVRIAPKPIKEEKDERHTI